VSGPGSRIPLPLCRFESHTCAACCWGEAVPPSRLRATLRRQTRLFRRWFPGPRLPGRVRFLLYELLVRRGLDLFWAVLLLLPGLGDWLRPRLKRRLTCAFLGFEDAGERRVGCLLHPSRWAGVEVRPRVAFGWLAGFACGSPDWYCVAAHWFARGGWEERRDLARRAAGLDWYEFSLLAAAYRPPGTPAVEAPREAVDARLPTSYNR
jgi:hypothetical protein